MDVLGPRQYYGNGMNGQEPKTHLNHYGNTLLGQTYPSYYHIITMSNLVGCQHKLHPSMLNVGISLDCTIYARSLRKILLVSILINAYPHGILAQNLCSSLLDNSIPFDCTIHVKSLRRSFSSINPAKCCMKSYFIYLQHNKYLPHSQHERIHMTRTIFST